MADSNATTELVIRANRPDATQSSIQRRLLVTFAVLAILPLLAAGHSFFAYSQTRAPIERAAKFGVAISEESRFLAAAAVRLRRLALFDHFSPSYAFDDALGADLATALASMHEHQAALAAISPASAVLNDINSQIAIIEAAIEEFVERQNAIADFEHASVQRLTTLTARIAELEELISAARATRADENGVLSALRFHMRTALQRAELTMESTDNAQIAGLAVTYRLSLQEATQSLASASGVPGRDALARGLRELYREAAPQTGLFALRQQIQAARLAQREIQRRIDEACRLILVAYVDLGSDNDTATNKSLVAAMSALSTATSAVFLAAIIGSLFAAIVYVWYVRRNVLNRLKHLTEATAEISAGSYDVTIDTAGNDEITHLAKALGQFRSNAVKLRDNELLLTRNMAELEAANRDLDDFVYVASHDLRSPLRGLENLASFIIEDWGAAMPDGARKHVETMRVRTSRLDALLEALLAYSRAGSGDAKPEWTGLHEALEHCAELFRSPSFSIDVTGFDADILVQLTPLQHVVRNLLDNAIKHHDRPNGTLVVDVEPAVMAVAISVRDDGPGIAPEFHDRVFEKFKTLKPRHQVESSGMGLAIIKKLVVSVNGSIRLMSDPATRRGTTIRVIWPVHQYRPRSPIGQHPVVDVAKTG